MRKAGCEQMATVYRMIKVLEEAEVLERRRLSVRA